MALNLVRLSSADLLYLKLCVDAGRVLQRSKSKPTQFVKMWLSNYADENAGVVYLRKEQRLQYHRIGKERQRS